VLLVTFDAPNSACIIGLLSGLAPAIADWGILGASHHTLKFQCSIDVKPIKKILLKVPHPNPNIFSSYLDELEIDLGEKRRGDKPPSPPMVLLLVAISGNVAGGKGLTYIPSSLHVSLIHPNSMRKCLWLGERPLTRLYSF